MINLSTKQSRHSSGSAVERNRNNILKIMRQIQNIQKFFSQKEKISSLIMLIQRKMVGKYFLDYFERRDFEVTNTAINIIL